MQIIIIKKTDCAEFDDDDMRQKTLQCRKGGVVRSTVWRGLIELHYKNNISR